MGVLDDIAEGAGNVLDWIGDGVDNVVEWGSGVIDGISETVDAVLHPIDTLLGTWGTDMLEAAMKLANKLTFNVPNISQINTITTVFVVCTTTFSICICLYKVIEHQTRVMNGSEERPVSDMITKLIGSSVALAVMPWAMKFLLTDIAQPVGEYIISLVTKDVDVKIVGENIRNLIISQIFGKAGMIVFFIFLVFFAYAIAKYFIALCVFYADWLVLTMLTPLVAMSLLTDENNYFSIWIKELLSQTLTMLVKLVLYLIMITILLGEKMGIPNFMVMVGCGLLLIKTPSALEHMWYNTKVGGGGGGGALSTMALMKVFGK